LSLSVLRITAAAFVIIAISALVAARAQQPAIPTVSVITAEKRPVTESVRFVGRIQAIERVDVRARVTGYLDDVLFKDGDLVKVGTPLCRIEKGPFEAAVRQGKEARAGAARKGNASVEACRETAEAKRDISRCPRRAVGLAKGSARGSDRR